MRKLLSNKIFLLCVMIMCTSSCGYSRKIDETSSIWEVLTYCTDTTRMGKDDQRCFADMAGNQDWAYYGNAVFALYNNQVDVFDNELSKISDKKSNWYLAGKIEEAFFKNNIAGLKRYLNDLKKGNLNRDDIFLLEREAILLAKEGYWRDLEFFFKKLPKDRIFSGGDLPILLSAIYLKNGKADEAFSLVERLKEKNSVSELIYLDYLLYCSDEGKARILYEESNNPSVAMKYGFYLFETGRPEEAKDIILSVLKKDRNAADRVVSTAIYMMRYGFFDFAKEIMEKHFKITEDFYDAHWKDSSDYYLYPAWWLFIDGNFPEAEAKLAESLKLAPRGYEENYLRFHLCTMKKDHACQQDAVNILLEHAPNDHNVLQLQEIAREDAESAAK